MTKPADRPPLRPRFWETVPLDEMTRPEWEAVCDGCGKCCLLKIEFDDTGEVEFTNVACRLLDHATCRCTNYALRKQIVPDCVVIDMATLERIGYWLPSTCAYRLLADGQPLADWHPLVSGDPGSVHRAGISLAGRMVTETEVDEDDLQDFIVEGLD